MKPCRTPWLLGVVVLGLALAGATPAAAGDLGPLVDDLGGTDAAARTAAYRELIKRKDPAALPLLRAAIPTWGHAGQYYGLIVLDRYPPRQVRRTWRKLVQSEPPFVRVWSGIALLRAGDDSAVEVTAEALRTEIANASVRSRMLSRVGWPRDERLRSAVRANLVAGAPIPVLVQLAALLHRFGDRESMPLMRALLLDERPGVRALAAAWLYDKGDTQQAQPLAESLEAGVGYAEFLQITKILAANRRVADEILDAVVARVAVEKNVTYLLQQIAFLGQHRYTRARLALRTLLLHPNESVARAAFDVLVTLTGPLRDDTIRPLLEGDDIDKQLWAAEALRQRDDPRGLAVAADVLRRGTVPQRVGAATLVATFTSDEAVEPLLLGLEDEHADVRQAALTGLHRLLPRLLPYRRIDLTLTGYAPDAQAAMRGAGLRTIRAWWAEVRGADW